MHSSILPGIRPTFIQQYREGSFQKFHSLLTTERMSKNTMNAPNPPVTLEPCSIAFCSGHQSHSFTVFGTQLVHTEMKNAKIPHADIE